MPDRTVPPDKPVMTNKAALYVLYDLAGGRSQTSWSELGRDLNINVEDIYKRNRPWPSDFGRVEYLKAAEKYAAGKHTSPYASVLAVRRSLESHNAYTDEIRLVAENVLDGENEAAAEKGLRRIVEIIIETARSNSELRRDAVSADGCDPDVRGGAETSDAAPEAPVARPVDRVSLRVLAALLAGAPLADGSPWYAGMPPAAEAPVPPALAAPRRVVAGVPVDPERFVGAFLPPHLLAPVVRAGALDAFMDGFPPATPAAELADALCGEEGLACRTVARRAADLASAADVSALFAAAGYALDRLCAGAAAADPQTACDVNAARSLVERHTDGDAGRLVFGLVLWGLVGPRELRRVVECPATSVLLTNCPA
jgi:hypothetical protein